MKTTSKAKSLSLPAPAKAMSFGDLIVATYSAAGEKRAPKILELALKARLVKFKHPVCIG